MSLTCGSHCEAGRSRQCDLRLPLTVRPANPLSCHAALRNHGLRPSRSSAPATVALFGFGKKAAAAAPAAKAAPKAPPTDTLPRSPVQMVEQAAVAIETALAAGQTRLRLDLLLPINEKEFDFMATEPVDYPCSLQKEFDTAVSLTRSVLGRVLGAGVALEARRIDSGGVEGEPCAVVYPEGSQDFVAVVFPTSDRLKNIQQYAEKEGRPLVLVNPQWSDGAGQVVSDFGIGPWKAKAENFLATFERCYVLRERRIGSPGTINAATGTRFATGGVVRSLRACPDDFKLFAMAADGSSQLLAAAAAEPSYSDCDALIKKGRAAKMEIFDRAQRATYVYSDGSEAEEDAMAPPPDSATDAAAPAGAITASDVDAMDAANLRRMLARAGVPTAGKLSVLRERLKGVIASQG